MMLFELETKVKKFCNNANLRDYFKNRVSLLFFNHFETTSSKYWKSDTFQTVKTQKSLHIG